MIIRIARDGQYEIGESQQDAVFSLDVALDAALTSGNDEKFNVALGAIIEAVHAGRSLGSEQILPADLVLPHAGSTLQEVRILLDSEAFED